MPKWDHFIKETMQEWEGYITWATVAFTATVSLLTVQSIDTNDRHYDRYVLSPGQLAKH
jgi:hypothetical protein